MKRELICIICPRGCTLTADINDVGVDVTGNTCPKGAEYATTECLHPQRTVTTTLRVINRQDTMVSVKTESPIPKEEILNIMKRLRSTTVSAPISIGGVLLDDLCGSRIIATKAVQ